MNSTSIQLSLMEKLGFPNEVNVLEDVSCVSSQEQEEHEVRELLPLGEYDEILVMFSGGRDSVALVLDLIDRGVPLEKIRLWHQCVDGDPNVENPYFKMDWPCTHRYCELFAQRFGLKIEFQWRQYGIAGELFRINCGSKPVYFEYQDTVIMLPTTERSQNSTRMKWPAQSPNLLIRWCSGVAKKDVSCRAIAHYPDFKRKGIKILVLTGERREESAARAKYAEVLPHSMDSSIRRVDHWRSIIDWPEERVWGIMQRYDVLPHPAYLVGWSRCSCQSCIYNGPDEWRMLYEISPDGIEGKAEIERYLNHTIDHKEDLITKVSRGNLERMPVGHPDFHLWLDWALMKDSLTLEDMTGFVMPAGAFKGNSGGAV